MGNLIDISKQIENEPAFMKITDTLTLQVNTSKNAALKIEGIIRDESESEIKSIDKALEVLFGKEGFKKIEALNLNLLSYKTIFQHAMSAVTGVPVEDMEKSTKDSRFQE